MNKQTKHTRRPPKAASPVPQEPPSRAAEALLASEENNRLSQAILQSASDGILAVSEDNQVLFANDRFVEMWRIPGEVMASKDDDLLLQYVLDQLSDPQGFLRKARELYNSAEESMDTLHFKDGRVFDRLSRPMLQGVVIRGRVWSFRDITERKRAEQALRESEERYRSLFDRMMDGVYRSTHAGKFVDVNPAMIKMFSYSSREEMLEADIKKELYFAPEERGSHILDTGQEEMDVYRMRRKDGSEIWVEDHGFYVHDKEGRIIYHEGMLRDVTQRKQAEHRLAAERNLLSTLIDHLPDNIFVKDVDSRIVIDNIAHRRLLGATALEEVVGKTDFDFFDRNLAAAYQADEQEIIRLDKVLINREEPTVDRDGQQRWLLTTKLPLRDDQGKITGIVGINRDITERKQAAEALRESEERFHSLFDNATIGIYRTTPDGRILLSNPAGMHMLGFDSFEEMAKRNLENDYSDADYPRSQFRQRMQNEGSVIGLESAWTRKDGSTIFVRESATAVRDAQGNILYYDGTFEDITARKRAEDGLRRRAEELTALQATVLEITAPHDLHILLQTIVERAAQLLGTRSGGLYLCDPARREVRLVVSYNTPRDYTGTILRYGEGAAGTVAQTGKPLIIDDYRVWGDRATVYEGEQPFSAVLSAPMIWQGQVTGVIDILADVQSRHFTETDLALLTLFANHAAIAVENTRLYEEAQNEITERKQAEQALLQAEAKYRNLFENATEGIFQSTPAGQFFTANPALARIMGYDSPEALIAGVNDLNREFYVQPTRREEFIRRVGSFGTISNFESEVYRKDRTRIWISENARAVHGAGGQLHYEGTLVDITERKQAEEALRIAEANYRSLFENSPVGIYQTTPQGRPLAVNLALARIVGYDSPQELLAAFDSVEQQFYVDPAFRREFQRLIEQQGYVREFSSQGRRRDGRIIWVQESARVVRDADGSTLHYEGFMTDITERKQADEELRRLSTHDALTGLYDLGFFVVEMERLERGREFPVSIVMADVDHLKKTNDEEGHAAGDALLKRVAQALTAAFRVEDVVARIGGDEFAVLLPGTDAASAKVAAQRVRRVIQENNAANPETPIFLSLGVSTAETPAPLSVVLKEADANMYREKRGNDAS